jgi:hypothetical protein
MQRRYEVPPADLPEARSYFSAGDCPYELNRIFDAGYITQAAFDEMETEIDWHGSILTPELARLYNMDEDDGLLALEDGEFAHALQQAERLALNQGLSCSPVRGTTQIPKAA